jgi:hypothetical protein
VPHCSSLIETANLAVLSLRFKLPYILDLFKVKLC